MQTWYVTTIPVAEYISVWDASIISIFFSGIISSSITATHGWPHEYRSCMKCIALLILPALNPWRLGSTQEYYCRFVYSFCNSVTPVCNRSSCPPSDRRTHNFSIGYVETQTVRTVFRVITGSSSQAVTITSIPGVGVNFGFFSSSDCCCPVCRYLGVTTSRRR